MLAIQKPQPCQMPLRKRLIRILKHNNLNFAKTQNVRSVISKFERLKTFNFVSVGKSLYGSVKKKKLLLTSFEAMKRSH